MEFLLDNVLERQGDHSSHDESLDEKERSKRRAEKNQYITKIAKHHIKWNVDDASYITVENAIMESLRVCLGTDFTAAFEVRMRYKYGQVKQLLQNRARNFQQMCPGATASLRAVGKTRMDELDRLMALKADIREPRASRLKEAKDYAARKEEGKSNSMRADSIDKLEATEKANKTKLRKGAEKPVCSGTQQETHPHNLMARRNTT